MDSMLVAFFEQTPLGLRLLRRRRRWERGLVIVCLLPFLPFVVLVGQHFWSDLQIGVWNSYLFQIGPLLPLVTVPLALLLQVSLPGTVISVLHRQPLPASMWQRHS